jgi:hypothetical protein
MITALILRLLVCFASFTHAWGSPDLPYHVYSHEFVLYYLPMIFVSTRPRLSFQTRHHRILFIVTMSIWPWQVVSLLNSTMMLHQIQRFHQFWKIWISLRRWHVPISVWLRMEFGIVFLRRICLDYLRPATTLRLMHHHQKTSMCCWLSLKETHVLFLFIRRHWSHLIEQNHTRTAATAIDTTALSTIYFLIHVLQTRSKLDFRHSYFLWKRMERISFIWEGPALILGM